MAYAEDRIAELKAARENQSQLRTDDNIKMSLNVDSEKRLKAENLALALGQQDVDFVDRNYGLLERSARVTGVYDSLPDNSVTKQVLATPSERASLPDAENLGKVEQTISRDMSASANRGYVMESASPELFNNMVSGGAGFEELYAPVAAVMGEDTDSDLNFFQQIPGESLEALGQMAAQQKGSLIAAGYAGAGGGFATGGAAAIPSAMAGYSLGMAKQIFESESAYTYAELRTLTGDDGEPLPHDVAMGASLLVGAINTVPEFGGRVFSLIGLPKPSSVVNFFSKDAIKTLARTPVGRKAFAQIAASYAGGVATEGLTEGFQELSKEYAKVLVSDLTEIDWTQIGHSAVKGAQAAIGLGAPAAGIKSYEAGADTKAANDMARAFEALGKDASNSSVLKNAPKKFQEFIKRVQEQHGTIDTVYLDSEKAIEYFQGQDMTNMPETVRELAEAQTLMSNGYVAIPLDEFVSNVAPNGDMQELYQDMTFNVDSPTPRMLEASKADSEAILKELEGVEVDTNDGSLYSQIQTELIAAGRLDEVSKPEAAMLTALISRVAERQGVDPLQFYRDKNISIVGEEVKSGAIDIPTRVGGMINVLRDGKGPTQKDVFGESLIEMLISRGGLEVDSELSARDLEKANKEYGGRRIAKEGGMSMAAAFEAARDQGYLELGEFASEEQAILDAIDRELQVGKVYGDAQVSPGVQNLAEDLAALERALEDLGIDINELDNDAIMEALGVNELNHDMPPRAFLREQYDVQVDQILYQAANSDYAAGVKKFGKEGMTTEARMARAKEQGFDVETTWYHGTISDLESFGKGRVRTVGGRVSKGINAFTSDPEVASEYAKDYRKRPKGGDNVTPVYLKMVNPLVIDAEGKGWNQVWGQVLTARDSGNYDAVILQNVADSPYTTEKISDTALSFDTTNIRSVNASFDPDMADSANILYQAAYHGTPHLFDKFSLQFMGEGEGAQAYGWGMYFAGNRKIADFYREQLSEGTVLEDISVGDLSIYAGGMPADYGPENYGGNIGATLVENILIEQWKLEEVYQSDGVDGVREFIESHIDDAIDSQKEEIENYPTYKDEAEQNIEFLEYLKDVGLDDLEVDAFVEEGNLYEVDIPEDSEVLDRDKSFKEQPDGVKKKLSEVTAPLIAAKERFRKKVDGLTASVDGMPSENDKSEFKRLRSEIDRISRTLDSGENIYQMLSNKYGSDQAASEYLNTLGIPGLAYADAISRGDEEIKTRNYVIWDEDQIHIEGVNDADIKELFQSEGKSKPRGSLSFNNARDYFKITLTDKANLSTFVHESGHLFLELMREAALGDGVVDQTLLDDYEAIKKFVGNTDDQFTTEQHELLARSMEAYVREGKAPSAELRGVFQKLKGFMLSVYKYMSQLRAPLTDEIRYVFDRALAADDAIAAAERSVFESIPDASVIGQDAYNNLVKLQAEAVQQATNDIEAIVMADIKRQQSIAYRKRRTALEREVTDDINAQPVYVAQSVFRGAKNPNSPPELEGKKLSTDEVTSLFGGDRSVLRKNFSGLYSKENTVPIDFAADVLGFKNGYSMLQEIAAAPKKKDAIKAEVNTKLKAEFGDVLQDVDLQGEAVNVMENNKLENFILASNRALSKLAKTKTPKSLAHATKEAARLHLSNLKLRQIRPAKYYQAEHKSARLEAEALGKQDYPTALKHNRERLLNHHLFREATRIQKDAERIRTGLKKVTPKSLQKIRIADKANGTNHADAITALLASVEFKKTSYKQLDARRALGAYVEAMEAAGEPVLIDPVFYRGSDLVNYKEMTIDELTELNNSINSLRKAGSTANKVLMEGRAVDAGALVDEMSDTGLSNADRKAAKRQWTEDTSLLAKGGRFYAAANASLRKIEMIANQMDGDLNGVWSKAIFQPFVNAQRAADALKEKTNTRLKEIWATATTEDTTRLNQVISFHGIDNIRRLDLYSIVLNMGNEGNLERLLKGNSTEMVNGKAVKVPGWERKDVGAILRELQEHLTLEDFKRIEAIGQMTDSFYPEMAAVSEKVDGRIPPKVEANPIYLETHGVTLTGWYYPVVYANEVGTPERQTLINDNDINIGSSPITGQVSNSMTKDRAAGAPQGRISIDMNVLPSHVNKVIHYTTHYEAIKNFDKLRKRNDFRSMYEEFLSPQDYSALRDWLQNIATDGDLARANDAASNFYNRLLRHMRFGTSLLAMGWNVGTGLMQPLGLFTAQAELGKGYISKHIIKYSLGAMTGVTPGFKNNYFDTAMAQSSELRHIYTQMDRDIREYGQGKSRLLPSGKVKNMYNLVADNPFIIILEIQRRVNAITFMAAQEKAQALGMTGQDVIDYAESAVRVTQSGGGLKDLAGIQFGSEITKSITPFYTYFSVLYGRLYDSNRKNVLRGMIHGKGPKDRMLGAHQWAINMTWLLIAPAIAEQLMRGDPEDEDWGDFISSVGVRALGTGITTVPVARDLYGMAEWAGGWDPSTPLTRYAKAWGGAGSGASDLITGEADWTDIRNMLKVGTMTTGLPFYTAVKAIEAAQQDNILDAARGATFGVPYENRPDIMGDDGGGF